MANTAGIDRIRNNEMFYHGTSLKSWTNPMWNDHGSLHLTNDKIEAEHYGEETSINDDASPVVIAKISGNQIKDLYQKNIIQTISPDSNWDYEEVYDDDYNEFDAWYESYQEQGIIVINGDISAVKEIMTYEMWNKDANKYLTNLSYSEIVAMTGQGIKEEADVMLNNLREVFLRETMEEMAYPDSWSWETFKSLKNFNQRKQYCDTHLEYLGSGSGRIAYLVDDDKVLKLAKNKKGKAQNEAEVRFFNDGYVAESYGSEYLARVFEYDEDGLWMEMELVSKIKKSDFEVEFGVSIDDFDHAAIMISFQHRHLSVFRNLKSWIFDEFNNGDLEESNPKLYSLLSLCQTMEGDFGYMVGDLSRISSFGRAKDGRIVIVDYGLTWDIYQNYYR